MQLTNSSNTSDWFYLIPAVFLMDCIALIFTKYPSDNPYFQVKSLDQWYTQFGMTAVLSDVSSILIGLWVTRYIFTSLNLKSSVLFFMILALFQLAHDLFFYVFIILRVPKGENQMIDVFKLYAQENGNKILVADFLLLLGSFIIGLGLKTLPGSVTVFVLFVTLYSLFYLVYTRTYVSSSNPIIAVKSSSPI